MNKEEKFKTESIWKLMLMMGIPTLVAQLVNLLYSIIDKIFIGHIPNIGTEALAGVGITSAITIIIASFSSFVGSGGSPLCSIALGENDHDKAKRIMSNGFFILIIFSIILLIIFYIFKTPLLYLVGASDNTIIYADSYLSIYLIGTFFTLISLGLNPFITCQGRNLASMLSIVLGAISNLILDPILIYGFNMGVSGAAIATVISQAISCICVISILLSKKSSLRLTLKGFKPDFKIILSILSLGIAPFVMNITESIITMVMSSGLRDYGGDSYVSALTIFQSVMQLIGVPISGFTAGACAVISYNYGAKLKNRVKKAFYFLLIILFSYSFLFAVLSMTIPRFFASWFSDDVETIDICVKNMKIFMFGMLIFGIQRACQATFVALKEAFISLFIALLRKIIILVPLAFILPIYLNVEGIYLAEGISDFVAAILCGIIFMIRFPKILKRIEVDIDVSI